MSAPVGKLTRTERNLYRGAEYWVPGSGDRLIIVYRCANTLRMAATISSWLQNPDERAVVLSDMRIQVEEMASSRAGPKRLRHQAALEALAKLEAS